MEKDLPKILCVDDEARNLMLLQAMLLPWGYEVLTAENGADALRIVDRERVDLILLDIMMPVLSGYHVCRRIKDDVATRNIPVIMLTSLSSREDRIKGIEAGADDFLTKPFDREEISARIRMLLKMRGLNERLNHAYLLANQISDYGESLFTAFNPLEFDFLTNLDRMVDLILGRNKPQRARPHTVIVGMRESEGGWRWHQYTGRAPYPGRTALDLQVQLTLPLPDEGQTEMVRLNPGETVNGLSPALERIRALGVPAANAVACLRRDLCLLALDYSSETSPYEASILRQLVTMVLFLRSLADRLREIQIAEGRYRKLTDQLPVGVYRTRPDGRILDANPAAATIFGYPTVEEFMRDCQAQSVFESPEERVRLIEEWKRSPGTQSKVFRFRKSDGSQIWVRDTGQAFLDESGEVEYLEGILEDVSERYRLDMELRENEERFRTLFECVEEGIGVVDLEERFQFANPAAHEIFDVPPGALVGRNLRDFINPSDLGTLEAETQARAAGSKSTYELGIQRLSGEKRTLLVTASPRRDPEGRVCATFGVFRDITGRKQMETALQSAKEELEAKVQERTEELRRLVEQLKAEVTVRRRVEEELILSNEKLKELDRAKTDFLSFVAHELRTPLTSIMGFAKILRKKCETLVPQINAMMDDRNRSTLEQMKSNLRIILGEGERLTSLINNVLDISRLEAGKMEWRMTPIRVSDIVTRAAEATAALIEEKGLAMHVEIEAGDLEIYGAGERLIQVMINLISNAVKFTPAGFVRCAVRVVGTDVLFIVQDTGIGIPARDRERVFDKFHQVGDTLAGKMQGTGLGLSISRQIVEHHGGRIWVESREDEGSTFFFTIPIRRGEDATDPGTRYDEP